MKKWILAHVCLLTVIVAAAQNPKISLIPQPASLQPGKGTFLLKKTAVIETSSSDSDVKRVGHFLASKLAKATGYHVPVKTVITNLNEGGNIRLTIAADTSLGEEGYRLTVIPNSVAITAYKAAGLFYGMQTLLQMFPKEIESNSVVKNVSWIVPASTINDKPRFGWRGLMFDVSRHFFTKRK